MCDSRSFYFAFTWEPMRGYHIVCPGSICLQAREVLLPEGSMCLQHLPSVSISPRTAELSHPPFWQFFTYDFILFLPILSPATISQDLLWLCSSFSNNCILQLVGVQAVHYQRWGTPPAWLRLTRILCSPNSLVPLRRSLNQISWYLTDHIG